MVAILKSVPPHLYEHHNLDPDWAGQIKVIGSKLILHSDLATATHDVWVLGTSVFEITMPQVSSTILTESLATTPLVRKSERPTSVGIILIAISSVR